MSKQDIKQLVDALATEIRNAEPDQALVKRLRTFEEEIAPYLSNETELPSESTLMDKAMELEVAFAQEHPLAEGIMREVINNLSRMGI